MIQFHKYFSLLVMFHHQQDKVAHIRQASKVHLRLRMDRQAPELMPVQGHKDLILVLHKECQDREGHQVALLLRVQHLHLHLLAHLHLEEIPLHHHLVDHKRVTIPNTAQDLLVHLARVSKTSIILK